MRTFTLYVGSTRRVFPCDVCGREFALKHRMQIHRQKEHQDYSVEQVLNLTGVSVITGDNVEYVEVTPQEENSEVQENVVIVGEQVS